MKRADIVSPIGEEPLFFYTDTFDAYLKQHNIDTLIYTGFATDLCILGAEGGGRLMLSRGYRCILMRDATVGVETPESFLERLATRYGIRLFEWTVGYSMDRHSGRVRAPAVRRAALGAGRRGTRAAGWSRAA